MDFLIRQLFNEIIVSPGDVGFYGVVYYSTDYVIVINAMLHDFLTKNILKMTESHKIMCGQKNETNILICRHWLINGKKENWNKRNKHWNHHLRSQVMLLKKKYYSHTLIFLPDVQERHIRYTKAADITIYAVTERHGLPTRIWTNYNSWYW